MVGSVASKYLFKAQTLFPIRFKGMDLELKKSSSNFADNSSSLLREGVSISFCRRERASSVNFVLSKSNLHQIFKMTINRGRICVFLYKYRISCLFLPKEGFQASPAKLG